MTTQEWIYNKIGYQQSEWKYFASVAVDPDGVVYSYGSHYPLAVIIDGRGYVNRRGYSATTAKHIGWAYSALADRLGPVARRDQRRTLEQSNRRI